MSNMTATTETIAFTIGGLNTNSQWALHDDEIEVFSEDDDIPYDLNGIPTGGVILLVILLSGCIGAVIFYISYRQERSGWCGWESQEAAPDVKLRESVSLRPSHTIERGLKLKKWEHVCKEVYDDDLTRQSSSSSDGENDEDDMVSVVSEVSNVSSVSTRSALMQDPALFRLSQKPRCVLCSKFFTDKDTVTESWEPSCTHHFHKECIVSWLRKKDGCPVCKKTYVVGLVVAEP